MPPASPSIGSRRNALKGTWDLSKSTSRLAAAAAAASAAAAANPKTPSPLTVAELRARSSHTRLSPGMHGDPEAEGSGGRTLRHRRGGQSLHAPRGISMIEEDEQVGMPLLGSMRAPQHAHAFLWCGRAPKRGFLSC